MSRFEVGEIAICIKGINTGECEIVSDKYKYDDHWGYDVIFPGAKCDALDSKNGEWFVDEFDLRKRRPPQELGSWEDSLWDDLGWNPTKQSVTNSNI